MKAKTIATALILSFAAIGAAQAGTPRGDIDNTPFQGVYGQDDNGVSRAQVVAELQQARAAGLTGNSEPDNTPFTAQADNGVSRAQVAAEVQAGNGSSHVAFGDPDNAPFEGV
ncbi:DUF4148 domain-containing protein [Bordetella genomosp. 9]|uniref:DUF4148 domain-containing protein n=1 Tax=Bordetella genomosp. 9 TaxID=1416803 RepID=A0A1W6YV97_9BORD|nr:DUF4148 domain-containing protein [Bordetella genomosp. 9]ARP84819.1 hypothetical protein CAL13_00185 [Bordetella genomosp. 9]ARP88909.1 hypothetical protein CAL14_00185 [Bordetella genomosp. 9]